MEPRSTACSRLGLWLQPSGFPVNCGRTGGISTIQQPVIMCVSDEWAESGPHGGGEVYDGWVLMNGQKYKSS